MSFSCENFQGLKSVGKYRQTIKRGGSKFQSKAKFMHGELQFMLCNERARIWLIRRWWWGHNSIWFLIACNWEGLKRHQREKETDLVRMAPKRKKSAWPSIQPKPHLQITPLKDTNLFRVPCSSISSPCFRFIRQYVFVALLICLSSAHSIEFFQIFHRISFESHPLISGHIKWAHFFQPNNQKLSNLPGLWVITCLILISSSGVPLFHHDLGSKLLKDESNNKRLSKLFGFWVITYLISISSTGAT